MSDKHEIELIHKAINGDQKAIAEVFKLYWRAARAAAFGITGNIDTAEDAAAEALYRAFRDIKKLKDASKYGPWLHTITVRSAKNINQDKTPRNINHTEYSSGNSTQSNVPDIEKRELSLLIREAVSNLEVWASV